MSATAAPATAAQELLQTLIRFNTVNPPGNELPAQEYLAGYLESAGFQCELLGSTPERPNLVARLPADGAARHDGPTLCYLGHVDTVLANPQEWSHDPWSGDITDGFLWGRGALDMKDQVAAEIAGAAEAGALGLAPVAGRTAGRDGRGRGDRWLARGPVDHRKPPRQGPLRPARQRGRGLGLRIPGQTAATASAAPRRGSSRFTVSTSGIAGHASMPSMGVNALLKMGPLLDRFAARQPSFTAKGEPAAFLSGIGEDPDDVQGALERLRAEDFRLAVFFEPMMGVTFTPTRITASEKSNVIPSRAELKVDCRVPPGLGEEEVLAGIEEVLGPADGSFEIEFTEKVVGNRSAARSPLMDALSAWVAENDPGAIVVAWCSPGFTDSRHFRVAFPECGPTASCPSATRRCSSPPP